MFELETHAGEPVRAGRTRLIPFAQTFRLHLPSFTGGLVWNRPIAILVQPPEGEETVLQIRDVTRQTQLTLLGLGVLGSILIWMIYRNLHQVEELSG